MKQTMKITTFRNKSSEGGKALYTIELQAFMERIKHDSRDRYIEKYREVYEYLDEEGRWDNLWRIPEVCLTSEYRKKATGQCEWVAYNGLSESALGTTVPPLVPRHGVALVD